MRTIEPLAPATARLFHLYAINNRTGERFRLTDQPCTHRDACKWIDQFARPARSVVLSDALDIAGDVRECLTQRAARAPHLAAVEISCATYEPASAVITVNGTNDDGDPFEIAAVHRAPPMSYSDLWIDIAERAADLIEGRDAWTRAA
jgi:hypothetical protein